MIENDGVKSIEYLSNSNPLNEKEYSFTELNLRPFSIKQFDFVWYENAVQHGNLNILKGTRQIYYKNYATGNHQLLEILRKEYPLN